MLGGGADDGAGKLESWDTGEGGSMACCGLELKKKRRIDFQKSIFKNHRFSRETQWRRRLSRREMMAAFFEGRG
jgi:hypothetical protein